MHWVEVRASSKRTPCDVQVIAKLSANKYRQHSITYVVNIRGVQFQKEVSRPTTQLRRLRCLPCRGATSLPTVYSFSLNDNNTVFMEVVRGNSAIPYLMGNSLLLQQDAVAQWKHFRQGSVRTDLI